MLLLSNLISGALPFSFLTVSGIYFSVKNRFAAIRLLPQSAKMTLKAFNKRQNAEGITSFGSACTALSATVGTGNIAGVAGAIAIGGAGAVFWMWISALLGMAVKAAEIGLGVKYRKKTEDGFVGGPMYYIKDGFGKTGALFAALFCIAALAGVFCSGNMTQANTVANALYYIGIPKLPSALLLAVAAAVTVSGGTKGISRAAEKLTPFMSVTYIALCLYIIISGIDRLPAAFFSVIKGAFCPKAVTGGAVGSIFTTVFVGAARGIFSNEAGLGTSAMAHSLAVDADPETQGLFGIFEVFADTGVICTLTAFALLCGNISVPFGGSASASLMAECFSSTFGKAALPFFGFMMFLFGFSSIVGWAMYGSICSEYLFGKFAGRIFGFIYPIFCVFGTFADTAEIWRLSGIINGIMLCINVAAITVLSHNKKKLY